jgi:quinolinate synthase
MAAAAPQMLPEDLEDAILALKAERNAVILAHYYQDDEIQDLADVVGDSLALARAAQQVDSDVIAFCGVHFMAETAKILNPKRTVVMPDLEAGCSWPTAARRTSSRSSSPSIRAPR